MDGELLQRFWAGHGEDRLGAASIADRILVFHRGISTVHALSSLCYILWTPLRSSVAPLCRPLVMCSVNLKEEFWK